VFSRVCLRATRPVGPETALGRGCCLRGQPRCAELTSSLADRAAAAQAHHDARKRIDGIEVSRFDGELRAMTLSAVLRCSQCLVIVSPSSSLSLNSQVAHSLSQTQTLGRKPSRFARKRPTTSTCDVPLRLPPRSGA
jgi:hypothetical protein